MKTDLRPATCSTRVAGRLLGFAPPSAFNAYHLAHPDEFPRSTERRIALADLDAHHGKPITLRELLAADKACEPERAEYRRYNSTRKGAAHVAA